MTDNSKQYGNVQMQFAYTMKEPNQTKPNQTLWRFAAHSIQILFALLLLLSHARKKNITQPMNSVHRQRVESSAVDALQCGVYSKEQHIFVSLYDQIKSVFLANAKITSDLFIWNLICPLWCSCSSSFSICISFNTKITRWPSNGRHGMCRCIVVKRCFGPVLLYLLR